MISGFKKEKKNWVIFTKVVRFQKYKSICSRPRVSAQREAPRGMEDGPGQLAILSVVTWALAKEDCTCWVLSGLKEKQVDWVEKFLRATLVHISLVEL